MYKSLHSLFFTSVLFAGSAFAGEIGVTNSYGHSFRSGSGTTNIQWNSNSQLTEQSAYGAIKIEKSSFDGSSQQNNGHGNGDQDAPGNSGGNNNAENKGGGGSTPNLASSFTDKAFAASLGFGTRNYTEDTSVKGETNETYSFGSTNFTHSVGVFSR